MQKRTILSPVKPCKTLVRVGLYVVSLFIKNTCATPNLSTGRIVPLKLAGASHQFQGVPTHRLLSYSLNQLPSDILPTDKSEGLYRQPRSTHECASNSPRVGGLMPQPVESG